MKGIRCALVEACVASSASAWDYVPIEQSRSYNAYRGPYWGGYYPRPMGYVRPIAPSYGYGGSMYVPLAPEPQPLRLYRWRSDDGLSGGSGYSF